MPLPPRGFPVDPAAPRETGGDDPLPAGRQDLVHGVPEVRFGVRAHEHLPREEQGQRAGVSLESAPQSLGTGPDPILLGSLRGSEEGRVLGECSEGFLGAVRRLAASAVQALGDELGDLRREEMRPLGIGGDGRESVRKEQQRVGLSQLLVVE